MPHLVNLSDDPLLAECLVYNIKPGTTAVGNVDDPHTTSEIRLNGSKIHPDHCAFENVDGLVTLVPKDGAGGYYFCFMACSSVCAIVNAPSINVTRP